MVASPGPVIVCLSMLAVAGRGEMCIYTFTSCALKRTPHRNGATCWRLEAEAHTAHAGLAMIGTT
jgi:hypothetical protein